MGRASGVPHVGLLVVSMTGPEAEEDEDVADPQTGTPPLPGLSRCRYDMLEEAEAATGRAVCAAGGGIAACEFVAFHFCRRWSAACATTFSGLARTSLGMPNRVLASAKRLRWSSDIVAMILSAAARSSGES